MLPPGLDSATEIVTLPSQVDSWEQVNNSLFTVSGHGAHQFQQNFFSDFLMDSSMQDLWNDPSFTQIADMNLQPQTIPALESPHKSSLLSRPVSPSIQAEPAYAASTPFKSPRVVAISAHARDRIVEALAAQGNRQAIPSPGSLSLFANQYFKTFHKHQPMLHEDTVDFETMSASLILAVCANGAQYSLESVTGRALYKLSMACLDYGEDSIEILQTQMLLLAFSAWSGEVEDLQTALSIQAQMTLRLRQERRLLRHKLDVSWTDWSEWVRYEALKRYAQRLVSSRVKRVLTNLG